MAAWARQASEGPDRPALVFAQEVTESWLTIWSGAGYQVHWDVDGPWRIKSALISDTGLDLTPLPHGVWTNGDYHGSYLVARRWRASFGDLALCSVHASPSLADPTRYQWRGDLPVPRSGGGDPRWAPNRLWDSDLVAASLIEMSRSMPLLAGGDFNESVLDDGTEAGGWGRDYFDRLTRAGIHDVSTRDGEEAFPTRGRLQLDHVLASAIVRDRWRIGDVNLDPDWSRPQHNLSDHVALWFTIGSL